MYCFIDCTYFFFSKTKHGDLATGAHDAPHQPCAHAMTVWPKPGAIQVDVHYLSEHCDSAQLMLFTSFIIESNAEISEPCTCMFPELVLRKTFIHYDCLSNVFNNSKFAIRPQSLLLLWQCVCSFISTRLLVGMNRFLVTLVPMFAFSQSASCRLLFTPTPWCYVLFCGLWMQHCVLF